MQADKELVEFIEGLFADKGKTWEQRFEAIVAWRKANRGLRGYHVSLLPTKDNAELDAEKVAEELCRLELESAKGELEEVDISKDEF